jgi:hypothetical protein
VVEDATTLYHVTDDLTVTSHAFGAGAPSDPVGSAILGGVDYLTGSDGVTRGLWSYANGTFRQVQPPTGTVDGAFSIVEASTDSVYFLASSSVRGLLALYVYRPGSSTAGTGTTATDPAPTLAATGLAPEGALGGALVLLILGALLMVGRRRLAE